MRKIFGTSPQECFEKSRSCQGATGSDRSAAKPRQVGRRGGPGGTEVDHPPNRGSQSLSALEQASPDWATESQKLREKVNELQIQNMELPGSCKRQAVGRSTSGDRQRTPPEEDFVPGCDEDIMRWMRHRQADIQGSHGRQCSRGGKVVPRDGLRSHKL